MNMRNKPVEVNSREQIPAVGVVDPHEFFEVYGRLETARSNLDALAKVFGVIAEQSTELDVVQPLGEAGQLLADNVKGALNGVLRSMGAMSVRMVREGLA